MSNWPPCDCAVVESVRPGICTLSLTGMGMGILPLPAAVVPRLMDSAGPGPNSQEPPWAIERHCPEPEAPIGVGSHVVPLNDGFLVASMAVEQSDAMVVTQSVCPGAVGD